MTLSLRRSRRTWPAGLLLLAAACNSGTGPGPTKLADPLATAADIDALDTTFSSPAFQSFAFASTRTPTATSPLGAVRTLLGAAAPVLAGRPLSPSESRLAAAALSAALLPRDAAPSLSIFPPGVVLGTTYEWNVSTVQYEPTSRTGAPANGVRFILYAVDPLSGIVIDPVSGLPTEIGYADLMDESSGGTSTLHIVVVGNAGPVIYVNYRIGVTSSSTSASVTATGYITDGTHRLDFACAVSATSSSVTFDLRFDVNAEDAHARLQLTLSQLNANTLQLTVNFRLQFGTEVITVAGTDTLHTDTNVESGTLTVRVNGGIYATITISNSGVSFTGGGGQALTPDDVTALNAIFDAINGLLGRFEALIAPAAGLAA